MKQPGVVVLIVFVIAVSFVVASEQYKSGITHTVLLTGGNEVFGQGDPDGRGVLKVTFRPAESELCYELNVSDIASATAANISTGKKDSDGPVLFALQAPATGFSNDCLKLDPGRFDDLTRNPGNYYVNVSNSEFPNGAIRGQLSK